MANLRKIKNRTIELLTIDQLMHYKSIGAWQDPVIVCEMLNKIIGDEHIGGIVIDQNSKMNADEGEYTIIPNFEYAFKSHYIKFDVIENVFVYSEDFNEMHMGIGAIFNHNRLYDFMASIEHHDRVDFNKAMMTIGDLQTIFKNYVCSVVTIRKH